MEKKLFTVGEISVMHAEDGDFRLELRDNVLWGVRISDSGETVERRLRRTERAQYIEAEAEAAKIRKAEEKAAKHKAFLDRKAEEKAANRQKEEERKLYSAEKAQKKAEKKAEEKPEDKAEKKAEEPIEPSKAALMKLEIIDLYRKADDLWDLKYTIEDSKIDLRKECEVLEKVYAEYGFGTESLIKRYADRLVAVDRKVYSIGLEIRSLKKKAYDLKNELKVHDVNIDDITDTKAIEDEACMTYDVCNVNRLVKVLKAAKIPQSVINELINTISFDDMKRIVFAELKDELTVIKDIGEKRAQLIIDTLSGHIPLPLGVAKLNSEVREQLKADIRERAIGFSCRTYDALEVWGQEIWDMAASIRKFQYNKSKDNVLLKKREELKALKEKILVKKALTVRRKEGRIIRLSRSATSEILMIDYEQKRPTDKVMIVNHGIHDVFDFHWRLFSNSKEEGMELKAEFFRDVERRVGRYGVKLLNGDSETMTVIVGASANHQKKDCAIFANAKLAKLHEKALWFGKTMEEFAATMTTDGAAFWKARANMLRPWMKPFRLADGRILTYRNILFVKDAKKIYDILNGLKIEKDKATGKMYKIGQFKEPVICGDGAIISLRRLLFQGQCSGSLIKGFCADGTTSIEEVCRKHGIDINKFFDIEVEGLDGKMHRIGDFDLICGEGCWKGDKVFESFEAYRAWMDEMSEIYPGFDYLYLLRQAEEVEDEEKVRSQTRSLIMQYMYMTDAEKRELTARAREGLKKDKTFKGAVSKLAGLFKNKEERSEVEKLFEEAPWLIMSPAIQNYLKEAYYKKQVRYVSGKFRTEGQYPYIMQDPVALIEIWVLHMDPNDPTLGILKDGEVSCADVKDGRKVLCVRFPANYLTARVRVNRACKKAFGSLNGVMVLSIHDLILIIQDGDVDGDEMCVLYNRTAIRLVERMVEEFKPYTVLFTHGAKNNKPTVAGTKEAFMDRMMDALERAKRYDSVGLYANLAMKCAYLAAVCLKMGNRKDWVEKYLLWMAAASTGAIISIDQVKGNTVDPALIKWLEDIQENVSKAMSRLAALLGYTEDQSKKAHTPWLQWYVAETKRRPILKEECLPCNPDNYLDDMGMFLLRDTGEFRFNSKAVWNKEAAEEALTNHILMQVPNGKATPEMIEVLGDNWFKLAPRTDFEWNKDKTKDVLRKLHTGELISIDDFVELLWRNEAAMSGLMEGRNLWEKKDEYIETCRSLLKTFLASGDWSKKSVEVSEDDKWNVMINVLVKVLDTENGSKAMFVLRLIAPELRANNKKNRVDVTRFFQSSVTTEEIIEEVRKDDLQEKIEDEQEQYESDEALDDELIELLNDSIEMSDECPF